MPEPMQQRQLDRAAIDERLRSWAATSGLRMAPAAEFVLADDVVAAAQAGTCILDTDAWFAAAVRRALEQVCGGRVARSKLPHARSAGNPAIHWGVTSAALPAAPLVAPPRGDDVPPPMKNKKLQRVAWRRARGIPEPDPRSSRIVGKRTEPHFTRYTDELLGLTSGPQMLQLKLFPNAKELSESFACFHAAREHLGESFQPDDSRVLLVCVGDGMTPRTAALFCFRTRWRCVSIDPLLTDGPAAPEGGTWAERVERLTALRGRLQDVAPAGGFAAERVVLVLPHCHYGLDDSLRHVRWRSALAAVVMPCCNFYAAADGCGAPLHQEDDLGVVSPHRQVSVWCWRRGDALPPAVPPPAEGAAEGEGEAVDPAALCVACE